MSQYSVAGKSLPRLDAVDKVTGAARFGADLRLPGMLVGKVLRSPYPHARLVSIDCSQAERMPGVAVAVTARDAPRERIGRQVRDRPILAYDRVRHIGEAVAAVAALDEHTAEEALAAIRVEYEELPAVFDPFAAMQAGAPLLHEELAGYEPPPPRRQSQGNILHQVHFTIGDVAAAWGQADFIYEDSYSTQSVHQGFVQPHQATAMVDGGGKVTLWASTKAPFAIREMVAQALRLPLSRIRVIAATVGGDFGGKGTAGIEPLCVLLALKSGRPVRLALSREEEFTATFIRSRAFIRLKAGARRDGTLVALEGRVVTDVGAYYDGLLQPTGRAVMLRGPYIIPNVDIRTFEVYTSNTPTGHVRAPHTPQLCFAIESHIDAMARKLGLDPIEMRLKNGVEEGDRIPEGELRNVGLKQTLGATAGYLSRQAPAGPNQGWGVACGQWGIAPLRQGATRPSAALVKINEDGTVVLNTGVTSSGGGQLTILAQIVAEVLGVPFADVSVIASDTDATPYEMGTGGSRTTAEVGTTARLAAEDARRQLLRLAAARLEVNPEALELAGGQVYPRDNPAVGVSLATLAAMAPTSQGGPILGSSANLREERVSSLQGMAEVIDSPQYTTHAAQVEVDPETGQVKVLKYFAAHDVGFALNPANVEGQIQGGVAFGLGYALTEEIISREGKTLTPTLLDYRLPTAADVPQIDMAIIEQPADHTPFGVKGIGEPSTVPVAAAIANAVHSAVGVRLTDLPLTAEKVLSALKQKSHQEGSS